MFEQEYKRTNDRIHPREDLLQEMEAQWAAEKARRARERRKVASFPTWARFVSAAAGVLLCIGLGMGSVLLYARGRGLQNKSASAQPPLMADAVVREEEAKIVTAPTVAMEKDEPPAELEAEAASDEDMAAAGAEYFEAELAAAPVGGASPGMHPAMDEAEVENAIRGGAVDGGKAAKNEAAPYATSEPTPPAESGAKATQGRYARGEILQREDLIAVFMPTVEQMHVVRYANYRLNNVFSLSLRENGAQVKQVFWMGTELLAVRQRSGVTELIHFNVADWSAPRHLRDLSQSGAFLAAAEVNGRLCILSRYGATDEEPLPWVDRERMDFANVLLDGERPGDVFTVLTVYDPAQGGGFVSRIALLGEGLGAAFGEDGLLLWTGGADPALYGFSCDEEGLELVAEGTARGSVLCAAAAGEGYMLLTQTGADVELTILDAALNEIGGAAAPGAGTVRSAQVYEDGAIFLTADALHVLTAAGDRSLALAGDGFRRLTADRLLVISAAGKLQLADMAADGLTARGAVEIRDSVALLLEDPSYVDFDPATGRLVFPAGQKVYQYLVNEAGDMSLRGTPLGFYDHDERDQREIRCLLTADRALVFYRSGIHICNLILERMLTDRY